MRPLLLAVCLPTGLLAQGAIQPCTVSQLDGLDGPVNATDDAFVRDRATGRTMQVSRSSTGAFGNAGSGPLAQFGGTWPLATMAMATNPPLAVFNTLATNMVPWDGNGGVGAWSLAIPPLPALVGLTLHATALRLDFTGPTLLPAIGNVGSFAIR